MSCAVKGCSNCRRLNISKNIHFHLFPKGDLLNVWLEAIDKDGTDFIWTKNKVVCSEHFTDSDYMHGRVEKKLKIDAVPSLALHKSQCSLASTSRDTISSTADESLTNPHEIKRSLKKRKLLKLPKKNISDSSSTDRSIKKKRLESVRKIHNYSIQNFSGVSGSSTDSSTKRRRLEVIKKIHNYSVSPRKLKKRNEELKKKHEVYQKRFYKTNKQLKLFKVKVNNMKAVIEFLKKETIISSNASDHLEKTFDSVPHLLMRRYLKNVQNETISHEKYPPVLRQFAATLQFYSNKAYEEVRKQFQLSLPHPATIRRWYKNVDCNPGFITEAFEALKMKVSEASLHGRELLCSLIFDEVSIRKQLEFDGSQMWGYVNIGIPTDNDDLQPATEALVLMVVSHQSHWKVPIAYFFIVSLTADEKSNIIHESLERLYQIGVTITSITCDGPITNLTMMRRLGCDFDDVFNMRTWFPHPSDSSQKIFCILDPCHMLKLIRNNFAALKQFKDGEGNLISWSYITKLYNLQDNEGLHLGNKLRRSHIEWYKQKMKVNLAAQTLSRSVADAIEFLNKKMNLEEFYSSEATVTFIRNVDNLFDFLNSKSPYAKGFKGPAKPSTEDIWRPYIMQTVDYLLRCTDVSGRPLSSTPKKTPFIGFAITVASVMGIYENFVLSGKLNYLLTYKISQDHLESFFCSIRSKNGWNNNPSCLQFMRSFKRLLLHTNISGRGGNCKILDSTTVLHVPSRENKGETEVVDMTLCRRYGFDPHIGLHDHDYDVLPNFVDINVLAENIITYISGFVLKMLKKILKCPDCLQACEAISSLTGIGEEYMYKMLLFKDKGGLHKPSMGVIKICARTDQALRRILEGTNNKIPSGPYFMNTFVVAVAQGFYQNIYELFPTLEAHFLESSAIDLSHSFVLVKMIIKTYLKIRIHNLAKRYTEKIQGEAIRRQLNRLILYNHQ